MKEFTKKLPCNRSVLVEIGLGLHICFYFWEEGYVTTIRMAVLGDYEL